ncbi:MAG: recombinase family protein [Nannocystaceae bacterium]
MRAALYVRVSTDKQTVANQLDVLRQVAALKDWNVVAVLRDEGISGAKGREERAGFEELHRMIASREIDVVAAWALDRLGRSMHHLVLFLELLEKKGVGLYLHQQAIDTTTPAGRMFFHIMGAVAEFDRQMIKARIIAGIERCKRTGKTAPGKKWFGRPPTDPEVVGNIRVLLAQGVGKRRIAKKLGVGVSVVQRIARLEGDRIQAKIDISEAETDAFTTQVSAYNVKINEGET